ncbi:MAG: hypothetical protein R6U66_02860 [Bacteroidales bacterium]
MNNQSLLHIIRRELKSLDDLLDSLENENAIHQLDKDFALSKVRNLYDYLLQIEHGAASTSSEELVHPNENDEPTGLKKNQKPDLSKEEPVTKSVPPAQEQEDLQSPSLAEAPEATPSEVSEEKTKTPETDEIDAHAEGVTAPRQENSIAEAYEEATQEEIRKETSPMEEAPIVADKYTNKRFRHDDLAHQNQKQDLSTKLQSKPITDINKAIGLNDRFLFIRELFNGNKSHYLETVELLNNIDTYENAVAFIQDEFDWNLEEPAPQKLLELIRRKLQSQV